MCRADTRAVYQGMLCLPRVGLWLLLSAWLFDMKGSLCLRLYEDEGTQTDIAFTLVEWKKK